jgi:hypothetical protein
MLHTDYEFNLLARRIWNSETTNAKQKSKVLKHQNLYGDYQFNFIISFEKCLWNTKEIQSDLGVAIAYQNTIT